MLKIIVAYLILINITAFVMFGMDKSKAQQGQWRIPEKTLLLTAALGGSLGAWLGMKVFHHKTLHPSFKYGVPAMLAVHVLILSFLLGKGII